MVCKKLNESSNKTQVSTHIEAKLQFSLGVVPDSMQMPVVVICTLVLSLFPKIP